MRTASWPLGARWNRALMASVLAVAGILSAACEPAAVPVLPRGAGDIGIFEGTGPCAIQTSVMGAFTLYVATGNRDGQTACTPPFPVVSWGNGTFNTPTSTNTFLGTVASHGFTVVAANTSNSNNFGGLTGPAGQPVRDGINLGFMMPNVGTQACTMGYSQGGSAAVNAARGDARVVCTVGIAAERNITGAGVTGAGLTRAIFLGGSADTVAPVPQNSQVLFDTAGAPKVLAVLTGLGHLEVLSNTNGGRYRGFAIAALVLNLRTSDPNFAAASRLYNGNGVQGDARVMRFVRTGTF
jgi:hypothetical protein